MRAYSEWYLDDAQQSLGEMLDYVVSDCGMSADSFMMDFVRSGLARRFSHGDPGVVAGKSGFELASSVNFVVRGSYLDAPALQPLDCSSWYWTGWILAYYQWESAYEFDQLMRWGLTPSAVEGMYVLHEADVSVFSQRANALIAAAQKTEGAPLKRIRKAAGLTQAQLAEAAGVSVRMVQLYEQRQNDINVASASPLARLSRVLGCQIEDLLENPLRDSYEYEVVRF